MFLCDEQFVGQFDIYGEMDFQPAFVDFQIMDVETAIDHLLNQVGQAELGNVFRFLDFSLQMFQRVVIGLEELLGSRLRKFGQADELVGG